MTMPVSNPDQVYTYQGTTGGTIPAPGTIIPYYGLPGQTVPWVNGYGPISDSIAPETPVYIVLIVDGEGMAYAKAVFTDKERADAFAKAIELDQYEYADVVELLIDIEGTYEEEV